jgi:hypothetical protein
MGKQIAWDYLQHYARPIPGATFNASELRCDLPNGGQVRIYGADSPDFYADLLHSQQVLKEAALTTYRFPVRPGATALRMNYTTITPTNTRGEPLEFGQPRASERLNECEDSWNVSPASGEAWQPLPS